MAVINGIAHSSGGFYPVEIQQSLRFDAASNSYLSRTPSVAGNRKTWTYSVWIKRSSLGGDQFLLHANPVPQFHGFLQFLENGTLRFSSNDNATTSADYRTSAVFRDTSAWYHICLSIDYTVPAVNLYVNGVLQQWGTIIATPTTADVTAINNNVAHDIGRYTSYSTDYYNGYMAETYFIDGQALDATAFGQFKNGVWVPKKYSGSYGTNGFHLDYSDGANIGADRSGNGNNYTPINLASTDIMLDSPTNNFCTLNTIEYGATKPDYTRGNLQAASIVQTDIQFQSIIMVDSGIWYYECCNLGTAGNADLAGFGNSPTNNGSLRTNGNRFINNLDVPDTKAQWDNLGDVAGLALDAATGQITAYVNGVNQGLIHTLDMTEPVGVFYFLRASSSDSKLIFNFGQDSSFAGAKTRQGFTDANGVGDFYYQPPEGALALCTANLPEPAFSPLEDRLPSDHFNTILWTGDDTTTRSLTGVGFQPDWVWFKCRNQSYSNVVFDSVRGAGKALSTNATGAEILNSSVGYLTSFDTDGFSVTGGTSGTEQVNQSGASYVAWNWKAGGAPVTNNAGSITSTVSANVEAGFSVVSYTGTGANNTVGHGLSSAPDLMIIKNRTNLVTWHVYLKALGANASLQLDLDQLVTTGQEWWNSTPPNGSVFSVGNKAGVNESGSAHIAYCFHSVDGFSKVGTYTGNGILNDGTFVYTGFKPAYLMIKRTDAVDNWHVLDNTRDPYNQVDQLLNPNLADAEVVYPDGIDFLSNGFKHRGTGAGINADGGNYFYMAFAEMPFKYANGR